jgi:hypothetical protein
MICCCRKCDSEVVLAIMNFLVGQSFSRKIFLPSAIPPFFLIIAHFLITTYHVTPPINRNPSGLALQPISRWVLSRLPASVALL